MIVKEYEITIIDNDESHNIHTTHDIVMMKVQVTRIIMKWKLQINVINFSDECMVHYSIIMH